MATTRTNKLLLTVAMSGVVVIGSARLLSATTATVDLPIAVTVANNCTITAVAVGFPNYDPISTHASTPDDSTSGSVTITCTKGAATTIGLSLGANFTGTQARMLNGAANYLNYGLYQDAGHTTAWGNAGASLFTPPVAPSKDARTYPVYARIPAGQDVPAGTYTDTVTASVNF
jgi:spore coat protein U-like protein